MESQEDATSAQEFFWDREVERITEFNEEASTVDETSNGDSLDSKIEEWKSQLLDLTRRNSLVSFSPTKTKSLPFERADPTVVASELDDGGALYVRKRRETDEDERTEGERDHVEYDEEHGDEDLDSVDGTDRPGLEPHELLPTRLAEETEDSLIQIRRKNKQYLRERGVDSLYLSLGMLSWYSVDYSEEANRSPLFLAPVELEQKTIADGTLHDYVVTAKAEGLRLNPALRKKLAAERGIDLPADTALSLDDIDAAFESVYETLRGFDRWTIRPDVVLGIFDFTKLSLYSDLERNREAIKENPIVRALNGDTETIRRKEGDVETPSAEELDDLVDPADTYQVLDADSSQQVAIEAAKRGKSFVLQGPPGTGKSQTIANIIAEKLAEGERVLFVSEKQAALDVVKNRLDDVGLGRFCLEVHGEKANNTDVLAALEDELKASQIKSAEERPERLRKLRDRRETINEHGEKLFYSPNGWDLTTYQAFGIVSEHEDAPRIAVGIDNPLAVDQDAIREAVDELETLAQFEREIETTETSPWRHTTLERWGVDTGETMQRALERQADAIVDLHEIADTIHAEVGVSAFSFDELEEASQLLAHLADRPDVEWREEFFEGSFAQEGERFAELAELERERAVLVDELSERYERSFFSADGSSLNAELAAYGFGKGLKPSYRSLKRRITNHAQPEYDPDHDQLLEDTRKLAEIQHIEDRREDYRDVVERLGPLYQGGETDWESLALAQKWIGELEEFDSVSTRPATGRLVDDQLPDVEPMLEEARDALAAYDDAAAFFEGAMAVEEMRIGAEPYRQASFEDLSRTLDELRETIDELRGRVRFTAQVETVHDTVAGEYVDRFIDGDYDADQLVPAFEKRFYTKWLNEVYARTDLGSFNTDEMERYVEEFCRLDREQQELAKIEVQHEVTTRRPSLDLEHASSSAQVLVRRETEKLRRHKPLRELFDEAGSFIAKLTPCFMMSPLSVAQYLRADSIEFDAVVFDEASQIMPQDAVSSLIRADQAIIAGDTKQLPPTAFFQSDVETTEDVREDLDSILEETASVLPEKNLRWHYRSRTEELIQFSNHHYYNRSLRTFPENDPAVETGVSFEYVEDGVYDRGDTRRNEPEAERVVDLIEEHAANNAEKSLGVVAFSTAQEYAIRDELAERREESAVLDAFVTQDNVLDEFFVKNLEMVQGDERDRMIFSVGYGPDPDGNISTNFGPLNNAGGERRLNVAVTRAKEQITVVCSMQPGEIDLSGSSSTGAAHFKNYLEYAKRGERALARRDGDATALDFESRFEEAVYDTLKDEGYDVSQVESSSYSLDLAIAHPERPEEYVLGIECDGAAYHSSKTARDRDRTRRTVLEDLGWNIHRIWSPDWTSNREREVEKIAERIECLLDGEDEPSTVEADEVPTHEPETIASESEHGHEALTEYEEPSLNMPEQYADRYSVEDRGRTEASRNAVRDVVVDNGPIRRDVAMQVCVDVWEESRAGKKVKQAFEDGLQELKRGNAVYELGEFLWPAEDDLDFRVRVNTAEAGRSVDEIPKEELAKAIAIILAEGGPMTRDDLVLEATRLIGYQRRGKRIEKRLGLAIKLLEDMDAIEDSANETVFLREDVDVDEELLRRVYV